jgi:plastocyanin
MSAAVPGTSRTSSSVRLAAAAAALGLFAAACAANAAPPDVPVQQGGPVVVQVVDSLNDAGRVPSVVLDADGNPSVAYLLLSQPVKKGQIPPAPLAGQPQPPSVMVASFGNSVWTRTAVTGMPALGQKAVGKAVGLTFKDGTSVPGLHTSVAVDGQGKHQVVWTASNALFYDTDAAGTFGDPQKVVETQTSGASIALAADGSPWISFYQSSGLRAAHLTGGTWQIEDVAPGAGPAGGTAVVSAIGVGSDGEPLIAYGNDGRTELARRSGGGWTTEQVPGDGGYGVSMAMDQDGNPHLAYYDAAGHVRHAHSISHGAWQVDDLAQVAGAAGPVAGWSTGIALDGKGTHHVTWADTGTHQVFLASNAGGSFQATPIAGSSRGLYPAIAVSQDGDHLAVAWYDSLNLDLDVATSGASGLLAFSPPPVAATTVPPTTAQCAPKGTTVDVSAKNVAFDTDCLAAPADTAFKIVFDNQDASIPHNVDIYSDSSATKHLGGANGTGDIVVGPATATYNVDPLPAGSYYFQCDIHTTMHGTFVVAKK